MNTMKSTLTALAVSASLMTVPASAAQDNDKKADRAAAVGMGTGVVIGTLVAGPAGAAVAGIIGALIGKDVVNQEELSASRQKLSATQQELLAMRESLFDMQQEAQLKTTQVAFTESEVQQVMSVQSSIQFKTGSYTIEPGYQEQLGLVAKALKSHPKLQLRLTGHADNRGDAKYNQALSMQRALSVKSQLTEMGVNAQQILTVAVGEKDSQPANNEDAFFDRKVVLELAEDEQVLTARR